MNKLTAAAVGVGLTLSAGMVALATPAMANGTCTTWTSSNRAIGYGKCTGGTTILDTHRVKAVCIGPTGSKFNVYGAWVNTRKGQTSKAVCTTNTTTSGVEVFSLSVETDSP
ncbi:hypothetical protein [Streptomyces hokutonensis]|uniref:Uncharacterized protein n=1 Tax=Streptomyces hokutonensis TaxID=1306990 RepID=A0ABW6LZ72_9ACTN